MTFAAKSLHGVSRSVIEALRSEPIASKARFRTLSTCVTDLESLTGLIEGL